MKRVVYFLLLFMISCQGKKEGSNLGYFTEFEFSIDTVLIETGEVFLFLKYGLLNSGIDESRKYFYNFNETDVTLEKINLDDLRLEAKLPFEREGPDGIGSGLGIMRVLENQQISITQMYQSSLFSMDGKKQMTVYYDNFTLAEWHSGGDQLKADRVLLDPHSDRLYGLIHSNENKGFELGILYLDEYEVSRIALKSFEKAPDYSFIYYYGKLISGITPKVYIEKFSNMVVLSNEFTSTLMYYDTEMDSLLMKSYTSQLTADQKEKDYIKEHETEEQFEEEYARYKEEINFMPPFWDKENKCFYRFSYEEYEGKTDVYLTSFDEDLNKVGETVVPQLNKKPAKHFAKDGKIWIYENINDEMGFVRISLN